MQRARAARSQPSHTRYRHHRASTEPEDDAVILVVDDDPSLRAAFAVVLAELGPPVLEASGGREALSLAVDHDVALVVLDNRMPDKSGLEVLAALRARPATARVPVIFVTGVADVSERVRALEAGAHDYLVKPVDVDELRARVRSHLVRHQDSVAEEDRLRRLASAAATLSRSRAGGSLELIASAACRELGQLHDSVDIALHVFSGQGTTECLAAQRGGAETSSEGRPLDPETARRAYQRSFGGPWVETTHAGLFHARGPAPVLPGPRTTAWVPLSAPGHVLGVIVISAEGFLVDDLIGRVSDALVTGAELAPTVTSLLEPGLERRNASEDRRARLQRVMDGAFFPVFQPIVNMSTHEVEGYEALTRFEDGTRPEARLAEAASLGGLVALDAALCKVALDAASRLPETGWVSVNVSPSLLLDTTTLRDVVGGYAGPNLVLEVTCRDVVDDCRAVRRAVDQLGVDVRLSVDDVGGGWSCLHHVIDLEPSFMKLDPGWVRGLEHDPTRQALIRGLHRFSRRRTCQLIVEGVETPTQAQTLAQLDVDLGQGFVLGRPSRADSFGAQSGVFHE